MSYLVLLIALITTLTATVIYCDPLLNKAPAKEIICEKSVPSSHLKGGFKPKKDRVKLPKFRHDLSAVDLPESFDWRDIYPNCDSLTEIREQGCCGSCWAFGSAEAISDRICIHSNGKVNVYISAEDLLTCCHECGDGCNGGDPLPSYQYWKTDGIVSGGPYQSNRGCRPYEVPPCAEVNNVEQPTPACTKTCLANYPGQYQNDLHFAKSVYSVENDARHIQAEIMLNGPVTASYRVYSDFYNYTSGIYKQTSGQLEDGHSVRILGWGVDQGTPYWLLANSWGPYWGENGYFRMVRGENDCGIEEEVVAGIPQLL